MDYDRNPQRSVGLMANQGQAPNDFDFDSEHDPERARRLSNMLLRRHQQSRTNQGGDTQGRDALGGPGREGAPGEQQHLDLLGPAALLGPTGVQKTAPDGSMCMRRTGGICFFDDIERAEYLRVVGNRIDKANAAYLSALDAIRVDELLKKAPQLGFLAELAINVIGTATGGLLKGAIAHALKQVNLRAAWWGVVNPSELEGAVSTQSTVITTIVSDSLSIGKSKVKARFQGDTPQSQLKVMFINQMKNMVPSMMDSIDIQVGSGDDLTLLTAFHLFDPDVFTPEYCQGLVEEQVARLEAQHLDEIGPFKVGPVQDAGRTEVVRLHAYGKYRLAVIEFYKSKPMGRSHGEVWYTPSGQKFLNWIDDEFAGFATSAQEARNGAMKTMDVGGEHRLGSDVATWAQAARREGES